MILPACLTSDKSNLTIKQHKAFHIFSTRFDAKITEHKSSVNTDFFSICIKRILAFMWSLAHPPAPASCHLSSSVGFIDTDVCHVLST